MANKFVDEEQWTEENEGTENRSQTRENGGRPDPEKQKQKTHKKKRKKRRRSRKLIIIPAVLLIFLLICLVVFRVQNLQIDGSRRVSEEEVKELIQWDSCQGNTLLLWLVNRKVDVSSNDLLAKITVSIVDPRTVRVHVEEQSLVAGVLIGEQYFYVNDTGLVILNQTDKMTGLPVLSGLDVEKAESGSYLKTGNEAVLKDMLDVAECLVEYEITVDTVAKAEEGGYKLQMGKVVVLLGSDVYIEEKISELKDLLPELAGLSGTLHLENYDSTKDSIIFTKDS